MKYELMAIGVTVFCAAVFEYFFGTGGYFIAGYLIARVVGSFLEYRG
jgi:hypothetical protein